MKESYSRLRVARINFKAVVDFLVLYEEYAMKLGAEATDRADGTSKGEQ
jgi:hypothetical protein